MHERLIELWLDNSGERAYQNPFCQMLIGQGHRILHSTRHAPIEFGKDIVSVNANGEMCAFQLKGNPGSRFSLAQFREIHGQISELLSYPVSFPGIKSRSWHRSFLVTNGEIEEEVHQAIRNLNKGNEQQGYPERRLEIISRGTLLKWANDLGAKLWPSELTDINSLLEVMVFEGKELLPLKNFHELLSRSLRLGPEPKFKSKKEFERTVTSSALLNGLALRSFSESSNHLATITAWTLFFTYVTASQLRWAYSPSRAVSESLMIARAAIVDALASLCDDVSGNPDLLIGNPFTDALVFRHRFTLVVAFLSLYWFMDVRHSENHKHQEFLRSFLPRRITKHLLWGEGAIPQILISQWYMSACSADARREWGIGYFLEEILRQSVNDETALASPYYLAEDILKHQLAPILGTGRSKLSEENFSGKSYYARSLFHLLVRTNFKSKCKSIWPDLTRTGLMEFSPSTEWRYCLWRTDQGRNHHRFLPVTKHWDDLVEEARDCRGNGIPSALLDDPCILMAFVLICPHRGTEAAIRFLGLKFSEGWFIEPPLLRRKSNNLKRNKTS